MSHKLNMQDLIDLLTSDGTLTKEEAEKFVIEFFSVIEQGLSKDELVKIKDFGTFKLTPIQERESIDVNTQEKIIIPAHRRVSFLPAQILKNLVNKPFAHFETTPLNDGIVLENVEQEVAFGNNNGEDSLKEDDEKDLHEDKNDTVTFIPANAKNDLSDLTEKEAPHSDQKQPIATTTNNQPANFDERRSSDDKPPIDISTESKSNKKPKRPFLWLYITMAPFMILVVIFAYNFYKAKDHPAKEDIEESAIPKPIQKPSPAILDTLSHEPTPPVDSVYSVKTVKMIRGKTLRLIALDEFGSREFWVYIYLKNKDKIKNPDVVPVGLELVLPRKTEYAMDAKNPEDVAKAKKLGDEEMKKFW
ncbi:MAG: HU family DNA-binding protein [Dysgonamonadaceae bacterium]|jgi:nucleoid DNA-binding protein|nr:HU family DNA-binding protein [Dysgonamonadaceae bacterium]MDD4246363.1 HU family DNA-binding protein [Dysgonamonadaceae bacterium]MDD4606338.1 HU family DNA-binding protein [Dysgonamonadaceae bacterium]